MSAVQHCNRMSYSDLQQTDLSAGHSLLDSAAISTITHVHLSASGDGSTNNTITSTTSSSTTPTNNLGEDGQNFSNSPLIDKYHINCNVSVPTNIYNSGDKCVVIKWIPACNTSLITSSNSCYGNTFLTVNDRVNSLFFDHGVDISCSSDYLKNLFDSVHQIFDLEDIDPSASTANWSASYGCRDCSDWTTPNGCINWSAFNGYSNHTILNGHNDYPARNGHNDYPARNGHNDYPAPNGHNDYPAPNGHNDYPAPNGHNDYPAPNGHNDYPAPNGHNDYPAPNGHNDYPAPNGHNDYPAPNGHNDYPAPNGHNDYPAPNGHNDYPAPNGHNDYPAPNGHNDYPAPNGHNDYPAPNGHNDYPAPNGHNDYPAPNGHNDYPAPNGHNDYPAPNGHNDYPAPNGHNDYPAPNGHNDYPAPNGHNDYPAPNGHNDYPAPNGHNDYPAPNGHNDYPAPNGHNIWSVFNDCNNNNQLVPINWSMCHNFNDCSVSNGHTAWSLPPDYSSNNLYSSFMDFSNNSSNYGRYSNGQDLPFSSHGVSGPGDGSNSLYPIYGPTYCNICPVLEQSPKVPQLTCLPNGNHQNNKTSVSMKSFNLETSQVTGNFVSNNIYQDTTRSFSRNEVLGNEVMQPGHTFLNSSQPPNFIQSPTFTQPPTSTLGAAMSAVKEKSNCSEQALSVGHPRVGQCYVPGCQNWGPSIVSGCAIPVQGLNTGSRSSLSYTNGSEESSTAKVNNLIINHTETYTPSAASTVASGTTGSDTAPCTNPTVAVTSPGTFREKELSKDNAREIEEMADSENDVLMVKIFNHDKTKIYVGTREKPAQVDISDRNDLPRDMRSSYVRINPIEAKYLAAVKRFQRFQGRKKSPLEELLM